MYFKVGLRYWVYHSSIISSAFHFTFTNLNAEKHFIQYKKEFPYTCLQCHHMLLRSSLIKVLNSFKTLPTFDSNVFFLLLETEINRIPTSSSKAIMNIDIMVKWIKLKNMFSTNPHIGHLISSNRIYISVFLCNLFSGGY